MTKKLWFIFGPLLIAALCLAVVLLAPFHFGRPSTKTLSQAGTSMSANVIKGEELKNAAFNRDYIPVIGSSELSRMDAFHPSVVANKYQWQNKPFLIGAPGTQSLTHFLSLQASGKALTGKKAVVIISPQWFVPKGVRPSMFSFFYSPLQTTYFLLHAKNTEATRYAARRILMLTKDSTDDTMREALKNRALGLPLTKGQRFYVGQVKRPELQHQDQLFSQLFIHGRGQAVQKGLKELPAQPDDQQLNALATKLGQAETSNNPFGIKDKFYQKRVLPHVNDLKGVQRHFNYESSPEFADFQLMLEFFAQHKMSVQFVIPPVNAKWASYTGLSQSMLNQFDAKINYQLKSQGFNNIVDLTNDGHQKYFMQDTIHLGWRGWLKVDKKLQPFMANQKATQTNYRLSNDFFSQDWQNLPGDQLRAFEQQ